MRVEFDLEALRTVASEHRDNVESFIDDVLTTVKQEGTEAAQSALQQGLERLGLPAGYSNLVAMFAQSALEMALEQGDEQARFWIDQGLDYVAGEDDDETIAG